MVCTIVSADFDSPQLGHAIKTKLQTVNPGICSIVIFLEKNLGLFSPPHFVLDFSRKMFLMLFSIN